MEKARIGVVGAGFMGFSYAQIIARHSVAELAGVADISLELASKAASAAGAPSYGSVEELLSRGGVDGLIVATPEDQHLGPCVAALEQGIGVLVEKPIATTVSDGEAIIAAAQRGNALIMAGHVLRFDARYATVRETMASGSLGAPLAAYVRRLNGVESPTRIGGRCSLPLFLGVHDYDILRWVIGSEVTQVVARERRGFLAGMGCPVEDASYAILTFANGAIALVELNWILPAGHQTGFDQRLDVTGTMGRIELTGHDCGVAVMDSDRLTWPDTMLWPSIQGEIVGALWRETNHFVDCLRTGRQPLVTGEDGLAAVRIALAVE